MRKQLLLIVVILTQTFQVAESKDIYVSTNGNDAGEGTVGSPFRTLKKASDFAGPGDIIWIGEGKYREILVPANNGTADNPIIFRALPGQKVIISATEELVPGYRDGKLTAYPVNWSLGHMNTVLCDGLPLTLARWPNKANQDPMNLNPATIINDGSSPKKIRYDNFPESWTEESLTGATAWVNAEHKWSSWTSLVTGYEADEGAILLKGFDTDWWIDERHNPARAHRHYGKGDFFIAGSRGLLDAPGEWFLDEKENMLFIILPQGKDPSTCKIEMKKRKLTVDLSGAKHINIEGIILTGAAVDFTDAEGCTVRDCEIRHFSRSFPRNSPRGMEGNTGIVLCGMKNVLRDCRIFGSDGNGVLLSGEKNSVINCEIFDTNYLGSHSTAAIKLTGKGHLLSHNSIYNTGRVCISLQGGAHEIQYNHIYNPGRNSEDLGVLKSGGIDADNLVIHHNVIHNDNGKFIGIYFDNYTNNIIAHHNIVWGMKDGQRSNRPGHFHIIYNNTILPDINNKWGPWPGQKDQAGNVIINNVYRDTIMAKEDVFVKNNLKSEFTIDSSNEIPKFSEKSNILYFPEYVGAIPQGEDIFRFGHDFEDPPDIQSKVNLPVVRNYIKNGCFDYLKTYEDLYNTEEIAKGTITHWTPIEEGTAHAEYFPGFNFPENPEHRYSIHGYSLKLNGERLNGVVQNVKELVPGMEYHFMAFLKTDGQADVRFDILVDGDPITSVGSSEVSFEGGSNWKFIQTTFELPAEYSECILKILNKGPGTAYIDDAGIIPVIPE